MGWRSSSFSDLVSKIGEWIDGDIDEPTYPACPFFMFDAITESDAETFKALLAVNLIPLPWEELTWSCEDGKISRRFRMSVVGNSDTIDRAFSFFSKALPTDIIVKHDQTGTEVSGTLDLLTTEMLTVGKVTIPYSILNAGALLEFKKEIEQLSSESLRCLEVLSGRMCDRDFLSRTLLSVSKLKVSIDMEEYADFTSKPQYDRLRLPEDKNVLMHQKKVVDFLLTYDRHVKSPIVTGFIYEQFNQKFRSIALDALLQVFAKRQCPTAAILPTAKFRVSGSPNVPRKLRPTVTVLSWPKGAPLEDDGKARYVQFVHISFTDSQVGHANMLIWDKGAKTVHLFEPNGMMEAYDEAFVSVLRPLVGSYKLIPPIDYCPRWFLQRKSRGGICRMWSLLAAVLCLTCDRTSLESWTKFVNAMPSARTRLLIQNFTQWVHDYCRSCGVLQMVTNESHIRAAFQLLRGSAMEIEFPVFVRSDEDLADPWAIVKKQEMYIAELKASVPNIFTRAQVIAETSYIPGAIEWQLDFTPSDLVLEEPLGKLLLADDIDAVKEAVDEIQAEFHVHVPLLTFESAMKLELADADKERQREAESNAVQLRVRESRNIPSQ